MRKKMNLIMSFVAITMSIGLFVFGVYASSNLGFSISNNITFTPSDVYVTVEGTVSGYDTTDGTVADYNDFCDSNPENTLENWDLSATTLNFIDATTPIVFTFEITSNVMMDFSVYIADYNTDSEFVINTPSNTSVSPLEFVSADKDGEAKTLTFTVSVKNSNLTFRDVPNNFKLIFEA